MEEAARAARVDHEARPAPPPTGPCRAALEGHAFWPEANALERCLLEQHGARGHGFPRQELVDVGAIPVRVGNVVVRARRHEHLPSVLGSVREDPAGVVMRES